MPWITPQKRPVGYVIKKADDWDVIVDDLIYLKGVITGSGEQGVILGGAEPQLTISAGPGQKAQIRLTTSLNNTSMEALITLSPGGFLAFSAPYSAFSRIYVGGNQPQVDIAAGSDQEAEIRLGVYQGEIIKATVSVAVNTKAPNNTPQLMVRLGGSGGDPRRFAVRTGDGNEWTVAPSAGAMQYNPVVSTGDSVVTAYPQGRAHVLTANSSTAVGFRIVHTGTIQYWGSLVQQSDEQLKTDITPMESVTEKLRRWRVVRYRWSDARLGQAPRIGLIAQDVQADFPELVAPVDWDGRQYLGLDYDRLTALLVRAIQELDQRLTRLEQQRTPLPGRDT